MISHLSARLALAVFAIAVAGATATAQDKYPARAVTLIVPQAPGGANDTIARIFAQRMSEDLGQPFVVENRPGAGGNVGTVAAAKAPRDGYTLLLTLSSAQVVNPYLYKNAGFDPVRDFEPITPVATAGYILVANPAFPAKTVKELIALAKANPGKFDYASAGNGTLNHLLGEMLKKMAGIDLMHVPYKGASASVSDVLGGRVPISFQSVPSAISLVQAGKLRVLGVANEKRVAVLPDVPAISETLPGFGATPWYGLFAPAGTPKEVVAQLHSASVRALAGADLRDKMAQQGAEPMSSTPGQFAAMIASELPRWERIVKDSGAQVD
jgi:tripartite-type tricarboxylate transporter receptor subunit TctC